MHDGIRVSAIAAVARNGTVGKDGRLPWRIPSDLKYFQRKTRRHAIVMGRRTLDEIGTPLKRRLNVVLSRSLERDAPRLRIARTLEEALDIAAEYERAQLAAKRIEEPEIMVIGGPSVWLAAWAKIDRFYLTRVLQDFDGDTVFPAVDLSAFRQTELVAGDGEIPHEFAVLERT